jgi:hypothetical protein
MQNPSVPQQQQDANPLGPHFGEQLRHQIRQQIRQSMQQAAQAEGAAAQAQSGGPVVLVPPNGDNFNFIPPQVVDIAIAFFIMVAVIIVGLPLARAFARRLDRKPVRQEVDPGLASQIQRIEHTVDAMAIEVERISEAQRYMARLQTERADPAGSVGLTP